MRSESLDATGPDGTVLRAEFRWRGDRFGHSISLVNAAGEAELLLESLEGTPSDAWPPSPPLQSLHRETLPDGRTAILLVGAAGRGHWSASIEVATNEPRLIFDLASRHGGAGGVLGNVYLAAPSAMQRIAIQLDNAQLSGDERQVRITPPENPRSTTTRWKFSIVLQG